MKIIVFLILLASFAFLNFPPILAEPILFDENLVLEEFAKEGGWGYTAMTFVGEDILVLEKDGFVTLVKDGIIQDEPVLEVPVNPIGENGLLGITNVGSSVYLYLTEADYKGETFGNRIYKYEWNEDSLINPILLKELPSNDYHNGGALVTGLDNQVYAVIGDTGKYGPLQNKLLENIFPPETTDYMDTSVILRVDPEGSYYGMGIRNSFGLAIDPITGNLWATENGDDDFDEINLIPEKFNSGWNKIMGPAIESEELRLPGYLDYEYNDPEFSWQKVVAPTGITFVQFSETNNYQNSLFVGDCNNGNIYNFKLNENRDGFEFSNPSLQDKVANLDESIDDLVIGTGFGCITDIESGPDGYLYLITHSKRTIYRILPIEAVTIQDQTIPNSNTNGGGCLIATAAFGSELAPQVQELRELRENKFLQTKSGNFFMNAFNEFYYSFSPEISDYQREYPMFREALKITITPMISSLSILNYVDLDSEAKVLGYGISLILLNVGMYIGVPVVVVIGIKKQGLIFKKIT
ncbi:MAG: PQQ-dependent sugar dehydrogenase [Nitrosopumilus sp.]|nr:PQQ-dependent sugar dehydrogenase [Nitrosopumilus sp.]